MNGLILILKFKEHTTNTHCIRYNRTYNHKFVKTERIIVPT